MEFFDTVDARRSCRAYTSTPVPREALERALGAAILAPSAQNSQPWHFHVAMGEKRSKVNDIMQRTTVYLDEYLSHVADAEKLEAATRFLGHLGGAPVVIAISAPHTVDELGAVNTLLSVGAAMENLLLALADQGLSAVNVTFSYWVRDELADLFEVGADRYITSVIAVGYAEATPARVPRRDDRVTWYE
jgi:coenzyme F420-0:L-glutamate ligase / coenzyme F420-1:gamma-L-glutamate ligase